MFQSLVRHRVPFDAKAHQLQADVFLAYRLFQCQNVRCRRQSARDVSQGFFASGSI